MPIPVTVLVQTKNEAVGIEACLAALDAFGEVIVVDSHSTDGTQQKVIDAGHRVLDFGWDGGYPKKKQWQLDNVATRFEWILFLDADETPTASFIDALPKLLKAAADGNVRGFRLQLVYVFDGRVLSHGHRVEKLALLRRDSARFPEVGDLEAPGMGELEGHYQPVIAGRTDHISDAILHDDKDPVRTWFERHNRYSDWEAHLRTDRDARHSIRRIRSFQGRIFDQVPAKPLLFFIYSYLIRGGLLDGRAGFNYAIALSFYYWQIGLKIGEARRASTVFNTARV